MCQLQPPKKYILYTNNYYHIIVYQFSSSNLLTIHIHSYSRSNNKCKHFTWAFNKSFKFNKPLLLRSLHWRMCGLHRAQTRRFNLGCTSTDCTCPCYFQNGINIPNNAVWCYYCGCCVPREPWHKETRTRERMRRQRNFMKSRVASRVMRALLHSTWKDLHSTTTVTPTVESYHKCMENAFYVFSYYEWLVFFFNRSDNFCLLEIQRARNISDLEAIDLISRVKALFQEGKFANVLSLGPPWPENVAVACLALPMTRPFLSDCRPCGDNCLYKTSYKEVCNIRVYCTNSS